MAPHLFPVNIYTIEGLWSAEGAEKWRMKNPYLISSSVSCKKNQQNVLVFVLSYPFKRNNKKIKLQVTKKINQSRGRMSYYIFNNC